MATPGVTLQYRANINAVLTGSHGLSAGSAGAAIQKVLELLPGTATVDQADLFFADKRTLGNAATENLDLSGTLLSPLGVIISAAEIIFMYFEVISGQIVIGAAGSNPFIGPLNAAGTITLNAGEFVPLSSRNGWPVTAATADLLKVLAGAAGAVYNVIIVGRSIAR